MLDPRVEAQQLTTFADRLARLAPCHRDPERFHAEKHALVGDLRRAARELELLARSQTTLAAARPRPLTTKCMWMRVNTFGSVSARVASSSTTQSSTASRPFSRMCTTSKAEQPPVPISTSSIGLGPGVRPSGPKAVPNTTL